MNKQWIVFILCIGSLLTGNSCSESRNSSCNTSARAALSTFELPPGFKIELVAAEPLISDPVDMTIDEEGRMYVVEMHGYPLNTEYTGKVILLKDEDGDGKMDKRTVFAEGFIMPTGVMRWKKGVLVTDAPNVYYLEDTTGDGKADIRDTLLTGFAFTNPQYLVNNPIYGLDNWIYLAHERISETDIYPEKFGDKGKDIFYPTHPDAPRLGVNANGRMVRFRPDSLSLEALSASTQFGHTFDPWGHHFLVVNDDHIYQEVIAQRYLNRNPDLVIGDATESLSDHGDACEVFPITKNPEHQLLTDVGVITSACGILAYQGGAFPAGYNHHITLVCEPVSNLVHADVLQEKGATFTAARKLKHRAFLASTDSRFRPVNLYTGPDGGVYVLDYHREIIEHPEWMSEEAIQSGKLYNGIDKGRIYRITSSDAPPAKWTRGLNLNKLSDKELVEKLANPNIWWRRNAQRLLVDRNHEAEIKPLTDMVQSSTSAVGRLHALWTLEGIHQLKSKLIDRALKDSVAGIRENAIKLAELHLRKDTELVAPLLAMKNDPDSGVRFQLLCTLGFLETTEATEVRQKLLFDNIEDKWMQVAALSAASVQDIQLLHNVIKRFDAEIPAYGQLIKRLSNAIGAQKGFNILYSLLEEALGGQQEGWQKPLIEGLATGLTNRNTLPSGIENITGLLIKTCLTHPEVTFRRSARQILTRIGFPKGNTGNTLVTQAKKMAENKNLSADKRAEAIYLLSAIEPEKQSALFKKLITSGASPLIQEAALKGLSAVPDTMVSTFIIAHWAAFSPGIRDIALNTFFNEPFNIPRIKILLRAIQNNKIEKSTLGWQRTVILMRDLPEKLKEQARALLAGQYMNRASVINRYKESLQLKGNPEQGKIVYQKNCLICHRIHGKMGVDFGPDLGTVQGWTKESILINILDPNRSIAKGYALYRVTQKEGATYEGIIVSKTPNAIVLRNEKGLQTTISRQSIASLKPLVGSPMPVGLENKIDKQQMADLLAFIKKGTE